MLAWLRITLRMKGSKAVAFVVWHGHPGEADVAWSWWREAVVTWPSQTILP